MKRFDVFLKGRLTEGEFVVYSLPMRDSIYGVSRIGVGTKPPKTRLRKRASGGSALAVGASKSISSKHVFDHVSEHIGISMSARASTLFDCGSARQGISVGISAQETGKEIFASCVVSVGIGAENHGTASSKALDPITLGLGIPCMEPQSVKEGNLNANEAVAIGTSRISANAFESVDARPKNDIGLQIGISASPAFYRMTLLSDLDPNTLSSMDNSTLDELYLIEE